MTSASKSASNVNKQHDNQTNNNNNNNKKKNNKKKTQTPSL